MPRVSRRSRRKIFGGDDCEGSQNLSTFEPIDPMFAIRIKISPTESYCYDIRDLFNWFKTGKRTNPYTNEKFSAANIDIINNRIDSMNLRSSGVTERTLWVCAGFNRSYNLPVDVFTEKANAESQRQKLLDYNEDILTLADDNSEEESDIHFFSTKIKTANDYVWCCRIPLERNEALIDIFATKEEATAFFHEHANESEEDPEEDACIFKVYIDMVLDL